MRASLTMQTQLVFVSGALSDEKVWQYQLPALTPVAKIYHADNTSYTSIEAMADKLLASMPEHFILVGYSMGGYVALETLRQAPQRVTKLILISTTAYPVNPQTIPERLQTIDMIQQGKFAELLAASKGISFSPINAQNPELMQLKRDMALAVGGEALARQQQAIIDRRDYRDILTTITCPTLIITGNEDRVLPSSDSIEMANLIPQASLIQLDNCGHMPTWECSSQVTEALVNFIAC